MHVAHGRAGGVRAEVRALDGDLPTRRREGADLLALEQHVDDRVGLDIVRVLEDELHGAVAVLGLLAAELGAQDLGAEWSTLCLLVGQLEVRDEPMTCRW